MQIIKALQTVDQFLECHHVPGQADFLVRVMPLDIPHYENFILEILSVLPTIQYIESMVVLATVKESEVVPLFL